MKTIAATEARKHFGQLLRTASEEPVLIRRNGVDAAVVLSPRLHAQLRTTKALEGAKNRTGVRPEVEKLLQESLEKRRSLYEALSKLD